MCLRHRKASRLAGSVIVLAAVLAIIVSSLTGKEGGDLVSAPSPTLTIATDPGWSKQLDLGPVSLPFNRPLVSTPTATPTVLPAPAPPPTPSPVLPPPPVSTESVPDIICAYPWPQGCAYWIGIARCESTLGTDPWAYDTRDPYTGLFQIWEGHNYGYEWLLDNANNTLAAWELSRDGTYTGPWPYCQWR